MPKKFDTNPLDPEFPERARQEQAAATARQKYDAETSKLPSYADEETPTRTFNENDFNAYSSPFGNAQPMTSYKTSRLKSETANNRKVAKVGLPENVLVALPYLPFIIGLIAGILDTFVRAEKRNESSLSRRARSGGAYRNFDHYGNFGRRCRNYRHRRCGKQYFLDCDNDYADRFYHQGISGKTRAYRIG